ILLPLFLLFLALGVLGLILLCRAFCISGKISGKQFLFGSAIVFSFLLFLFLLEAKPPGTPSALLRLLLFALIGGAIFLLARWLVARLFRAVFPGRQSAACPPMWRLKE